MGNGTSLKRAKRAGYDAERKALALLRRLFPRLRRTGSVGYRRAAADLVQEPQDGAPSVYLVVLQETGSAPLVVLQTEDLRLLCTYPDLTKVGVWVQVKRRKRVWVRRLLSELVSAVRAEHSKPSSSHQEDGSGTDRANGFLSAVLGTTTAKHQARSIGAEVGIGVTLAGSGATPSTS